MWGSRRHCRRLRHGLRHRRLHQQQIRQGGDRGLLPLPACPLPPTQAMARASMLTLLLAALLAAAGWAEAYEGGGGPARVPDE